MKIDRPLFGLAAFATLAGMLCVWNARSVSAAEVGRFLPEEAIRQGLFALIALFAFVVAAKFGPKWVRLASVPVYLLAVAGLVAVELVGTSRNGGTRWLVIAGQQFQPSEFAKAAVVFCAAMLMARLVPYESLKPLKNRSARTKRFMSRAFPFVVGLLPAALIIKQPDMDTAAVILVSVFAMAIVAGYGLKPLAGLGAVGAVCLVAVAFMQPYRLDRVTNHWDRWEPQHVNDSGYQSTRSEDAIAKAGLFGLGVGEGTVKTRLPESSTDFIMTTVAEDFGFVGAFIVLAAVGGVALRMLWLAQRTEDRFARLCLTGVGTWIAAQTVANVAMANATLPTMGLPLPFVSAGGSSLIALWLAIGASQAALIAADGATKRRKEVEVEADRHGRWNRRTRLSRA